MDESEYTETLKPRVEIIPNDERIFDIDDEDEDTLQEHFEELQIEQQAPAIKASETVQAEITSYLVAFRKALVERKSEKRSAGQQDFFQTEKGGKARMILITTRSD